MFKVNTLFRRWSMEAPINIQHPAEQPRPDEFFYQINLTPEQFALRAMLPTLAPNEIKQTLIENTETKAILRTINSAGVLTGILEELRWSPNLTAQKLDAFWDSTDFFNRLPDLMDKSFNLEEVLESLSVNHRKKFWHLPNLLEKLAKLSSRQDKNRYDWHTFKLEHVIRYIPEEKAETFLKLLERDFIENEHDLYRLLHALNPQQEKMRKLLLKLPQVKNWSYTHQIVAAKKHEDHMNLLSRLTILILSCGILGALGFLIGGYIGLGHGYAGLATGVITGILITIATILIGNTALVPSSVLAVWRVPEPDGRELKK